MFPYWAVFALLAFAAAVEQPLTEQPRHPSPLSAMAGVLLTLFVGLRLHVGGDWTEYLREFKMAGYWSFGDALAQGDPGYQMLNWLGQQLGLDIWFVNLVCAAIFTWGLLRLARSQPRPWMVLLLSMPYLITVVAMGYTRQAAAIGIAMLAMTDVIGGASVIRAISYIAVATLFHKTALVLLPLVAVAAGQNAKLTLATVPPALYGLYATFLAPSMQFLVEGYLEREYASSGAAVRVALVLVGAAVFLLFQKRLGFSRREAILWRTLSFAALASLALLFLLPSSTVVDRLALYLIPLQMIVLGRIPGSLVSAGAGKTILILFAGAVLFVWLVYGSFSWAWVPYRNYLMGI